MFIKAYKDEKEIVVQGIHEPIITKELFEKAQKIMTNRKKGKQTVPKAYNENFPLK